MEEISDEISGLFFKKGVEKRDATCCTQHQKGSFKLFNKTHNTERNIELYSLHTNNS